MPEPQVDEAFGPEKLPSQSQFRYRPDSQEVPPGAKQFLASDRPTINMLLQNKQPVWVRNMTNRKLALCFDGGTKFALRPQPHPVELTGMVSAYALERSPSVFVFEARGALEVLWPHEAKEYYKKYPDAAKSVADRIENLAEQAQTMPPEVPSAPSPQERPHPRVLAVAYELMNGAIEPRQALEALEGVAGVLREVDYEHMMSECGRLPMIRLWAERGLAQLRGETQEHVTTSET